MSDEESSVLTRARGIDTVVDPSPLFGTWRLVSSTRTLLATNRVEEPFGHNPTGWINYGPDGRMMVVVSYDGRPELSDQAAITDEDRIILFKSCFAYAGSYQLLEGGHIEHHIDTSWNQAWTGTVMSRKISFEGSCVVYLTEPRPFSNDQELSVIKLIWRKYLPNPYEQLQSMQVMQRIRSTESLVWRDAQARSPSVLLLSEEQIL